MQLIKEIGAGSILAKRELWSVGNTCEAMVVYENGKCSINIIGEEGDLSLSIGEKLNQEHSREYSTTATIDSGFIEVPENELKEVLSLIEEYCRVC